jgi:hypothetical protein
MAHSRLARSQHKVKYIEDQITETIDLGAEEWRLAPQFEDEAGASGAGEATTGEADAKEPAEPPAKGEASGLKIKIAVDPEWPVVAFGTYGEQQRAIEKQVQRKKEAEASLKWIPKESGGASSSADGAGEKRRSGRGAVSAEVSKASFDANMDLLEQLEGAGRKRKRGDAPAPEEAEGADGGEAAAPADAPKSKRAKGEAGGGSDAAGAGEMDVEGGGSSSAMVPMPALQRQATDGGAATEFAAPDGMEVGVRVEVEMSEEGLQGARFSGEVRACQRLPWNTLFCPCLLPRNPTARHVRPR